MNRESEYLLSIIKQNKELMSLIKEYSFKKYQKLQHKGDDERLYFRYDMFETTRQAAVFFIAAYYHGYKYNYNDDAAGEGEFVTKNPNDLLAKACIEDAANCGFKDSLIRIDLDEWLRHYRIKPKTI